MKCVNHNKAKIYIKMSKNLSAKYYQENKERLQKKKKQKKSKFFHRRKSKKATKWSRMLQKSFRRPKTKAC